MNCELIQNGIETGTDTLKCIPFFYLAGVGVGWFADISAPVIFIRGGELC